MLEGEEGEIEMVELLIGGWDREISESELLCREIVDCRSFWFLSGKISGEVHVR